MLKAIILLLLLCGQLRAYTTENFVVSAPSAEFAAQVGDTAEKCRVELAQLWLGKTLPPWSNRCPIRVRFERGSGGATSFVFDQGEVVNWKMDIQGTPERLLDSVVPHEVSHTILASHFRAPLPRWADEGACCTVEGESERNRYESELRECLRSGRGIPFRYMLECRDYPRDMMALYAQGHSVARWLIERFGREKFIAFVGNGLVDSNWPRAIRDCYGFASPLDMQNEWVAWIKSERTVAHTTNQCGDGCCPIYSQPIRAPRTRPQTFRQPQAQPDLVPIPPPKTIAQPTTPAIPGPAGPPGEQGPPGPPGKDATCDCGPKWTEINARITAIEGEMKQGKEAITNLLAVVNGIPKPTNEPAPDNSVAPIGRGRFYLRAVPIN